MDTKRRSGWTDIKEDVWKTVESYTEQILKGEKNNFLKYFHKDYSGWNYFREGSVKKSDIKKELNNLPKIEILSYSIEPVSIQIKNDIAIVHYTYSAKYRDAIGDIRSKNGNYTDILMKEDKSWLIIGDHIGDEISIENIKEDKYKIL